MQLIQTRKVMAIATGLHTLHTQKQITYHTLSLKRIAFFEVAFLLVKSVHQ